MKESTKYKPEEDIDGNETESVFYSRLYYLMLQKPYFDEDEEDEKNATLLHMKTSVIKYIKEPAIRDLLLKIGGLCSNYDVL